MWKYVYEMQIDMSYLGGMFTGSSRDVLRQYIFLKRPSRVDYLVQRWKGASFEHKERLYFAILCGVPLKECMEWGVKHCGFEYDEVSDRNLSDYRFPYLDAKGETEFMSWDDYAIWLKVQKEKEGDAPEELLPPDYPFNEYHMSAYKRALTWGDWNKEGYVAD
jgi:hypothetical protein